MPPPLAPVHRVLADLRAKLRRTHTLRAASVVAAGLALAVLVSFGMDWMLELPLAVRVVHLCIVVGALVLFAIWASRPLRVPLRDADLAQAVEDVVPDMKDRLASALDFERRMDDPNEQESREMMAVVVRQADAFAARLRPDSLVNTRPARVAALVAAAALGVLLVIGVAFPQSLLLWFRRGVLLQDVEWPRRTHIRLLDFPPEGPLVITRGDDLRVVAVIEGVRPRELQLHYQGLEDDPDGGAPRVTTSDVRLMYPVEGETGQYAFDFRAVASSFRFWVTGGDDQDRRPVYEVRALVPPRISSIMAHVTYPEYSGLSPVVVREATFEVLAGSRVELELRANMPLRSARLVPTEAAASDLAVGEDGESLRIDLDVTATWEFHVELIAGEGQHNRPEDDRFLVKAIEDLAPDVRVLFPLGRLYRTPEGIVPVKAILRDDFGVAAATLDVAQDAEILASSALWPTSGESAEAQKRLDVYRGLELPSLQSGDGRPLAPGDLLRIVLQATDNSGNETLAPDVAIEILSREDLERRLGQRQSGLRDQLRQLRIHQRRTLTAIRDLRADVAERTPDGGALDRGRDLQVDQGRVTNELRQFLRGIHRVFDAHVLNRLGSIPTIDRLLPIYHTALAAPAEDSDSVFPDSLYAEIVAQKRERRLYDPEVLGTLLDIMDIGDDVTERVSPSVYEALRSWSGDEAPRPELLEEAERRAVELEARLVELERRMDRWEDLNEIIELAREIKSRQADLAQPVDPGLAGSDK